MLTQLATSSWLVLCLLVSFGCGLKVKVVHMIECEWHLNLFTNVENVCIGVLSRSREINRKVPTILLRRGGYFNNLIFSGKSRMCRVTGCLRIVSYWKIIRKKLESCEWGFLAFRLALFTKHPLRSIVSWTSTVPKRKFMRQKVNTEIEESLFFFSLSIQLPITLGTLDVSFYQKNSRPNKKADRWLLLCKCIH